MSTGKIRHSRGPEVFKSGYLRFIQETITLPSGEKFERDILDHPGAVVILPFKDKDTLMLVSQYRYPIRDFVLEFPAGTLESQEEIEVCAKRELQEEIGFDAKHIKQIAELYPTPGFCNEVQHIFVARDLYPSSRKGDFDEIMEPVEVSVAKLEALIKSGKVKDAKTIAAFMQAKLINEL